MEDVKQRSTEQSAKMLKLICIKVLDPKNTGTITEYTILRVPMYSVDGLKANYPGRVKFTTKSAYKHFLNDVAKEKHGGVANSIGVTSKEIRYVNVLRKELKEQTTYINGSGVLHVAKKKFAFPAYAEDNTSMLLSDAKEADRKEKIHKGIHSISNCRKLTKSRVRTPKGNYSPTGLGLPPVNAYDIISESYAKAGKSVPADILRDKAKWEINRNPNK